MSFFKKLKDKLTPPNASIVLKLSQYGIAAGQNLEGTLTVSSNEEFDATEIRCEIQCAEEAKVTKHVYDPNLRREVDREVRESATIFAARPSITGPIHITAGVKDFPVNINIPATARPTYQSIDRKVTWTIKGVVGIDGRPDVTSRMAEIQVAPPSASPVIKEKEIIREVVMIPCKYCGALMPQTDTSCPRCGAKRTA